MTAAAAAAENMLNCWLSNFFFLQNWLMAENGRKKKNAVATVGLFRTLALSLIVTLFFAVSCRNQIKLTSFFRSFFGTWAHTAWVGSAFLIASQALASKSSNKSILHFRGQRAKLSSSS